MPLSLNHSQLNNNCGYLELALGNMFSGKTTHIIRKITEAADCFNIRPLLVSTDIDNRKANSDRGITSHSSQFKGLSDKIDVHLTKSLQTSIDKLMKYEYIGIDEFTLFEGKNASVIIDLVTKHHKKVFVAGLSGDSEMELFGEMYLLIPKADNIVFLRAICKDHLEEMKNKGIATQYFNLPYGSFTYRTSEAKTKIDVGGSDKYIPLCRYHYNKRKNALKKGQKGMKKKPRVANLRRRYPLRSYTKIRISE